METLFLDESGYTGEDLLNCEQPTFAYASTALTDSDAASLVRSFFAFSRASELKHSRLSKFPRGQNAIVALIQHFTENSLPVKIYVAHKEYALLTYFVDFPIEELFHQQGKNIYNKGFNIALSNAAFYGLRSMDLPDALTPILQSFQQLYRSRQYADWVKLCDIIEHYYNVVREYRKLLIFFLACCRGLGYKYFFDLPLHAFDLAFSVFLSIAIEWSETASCQFDAVHDTSSQLAKQKWLSSAVFSKDMAPFVHQKFGKTTTFPLKVRDLRFAQSQDHHQLQVCDIVAGAAKAWASSICIPQYEKREYAERLEAAGIEKLLAGHMLPSTAVNPAELGTEDYERNELLDYLADQLNKKTHFNGCESQY